MTVRLTAYLIFADIPVDEVIDVANAYFLRRHCGILVLNGIAAIATVSVARGEAIARGKRHGNDGYCKNPMKYWHWFSLRCWGQSLASCH